MIVFVFAFIVGVDAAANPMDYPACPQRHQPEFYCCSTSSTTREVYTKFHRPTGGSYEDDYKTGWALPRQVNFPYVRYTPDSPIFTYDDPESACRIQTVVVDFQTGELNKNYNYFRKLRGFQETVRVEVIGGQRIVDFQHLRYVYNEELRQFIPTEISIGRTYADIGAAGNSGLTTIEAQKRLQTIGLNVVDVNMSSLLTSILHEFLTLFYIYQIMCYYVWYYFTYWDMGIVMTLVVLGTAIINIYTKRRGKKHTLFSGTFVLSSGRNEEIHAVVQTTGAHTTKGQLIQSILFPVPMRFNFLLGNGKLNNKMTAFCYCIFMISAVVSPLLPVVITVGQVNAATRLQRKRIFSLNVKRITLCGKATGWELLEREGAQPSVKSPTGDEFEFIKRFDFDHHRMSMSVVLSKPDSVPSEYKDVADTLAKNGCYVLGLSYRELPSNWSNQKIDEFLSNRDKVDENLSLLGLILFRNELKEDTSDAIKLLKKGDIRVVMITGDNAMCGCYIARNSGMVSPNSRVILADIERTGSGVNTRLGEVEWRDVDSGVILDYQTVKNMTTNGEDVELAVTGAAFNRLKDLGEMNQLLFHVRIFSRMTPDDKVECVKMHMEAGAVTGMCGDGGNDCGALRIAHAGIALSDADASVVSPFTSKSKTIHSVVDICREGRCSLATSFASVKFLTMYGVIASTLRLFQWYNATILSEWCFILADGFTLVGLSYVITLSQPLPDLKDQRPTSSLIGPSTLLSILGQVTINVIFLVSGMYMLTSQRWYCPFSPDNIDLAKWWLLSDNHLATTLFFTIITQQQLAAWRYQCGGLPDIPMPLAFRVQYFMLLAGNVIAAILFEYFVVLGPVRGWVRRKFHKDQLPMRT
ncbi:P-type ATPase, cytoplasmic domain N [Phytophthora cactorum]|nr:P-type ATPase, cytoplasmic domain N [Phytophthora cactorum]